MPEIRRIRQTEADAVVDLWGGPLTERGRRNIAAMLVLAASSHRAACFVAVEAERVVGFVLAELMDDGLLPCRFGRIEELVGGGELVAAALEWLYEHDVFAVRAEVALGEGARSCSNRSASSARRFASRTTGNDLARVDAKGRSENGDVRRLRPFVRPSVPLVSPCWHGHRAGLARPPDRSVQADNRGTFVKTLLTSVSRIAALVCGTILTVARERVRVMSAMTADHGQGCAGLLIAKESRPNFHSSAGWGCGPEKARGRPTRSSAFVRRGRRSRHAAWP